MAGNMEEALRRIHENKQTKAKILDLNGLGLTELPDELWDCVWVEELRLGEHDFWEVKKKRWVYYDYDSKKNNRIATIPKRISNLHNLTCLFFKGNPISGLDFLISIPTLEIIDLSSTKIRSFNNLKYLANLKYLDLSDNWISDITQLAGLVNLNNLCLRNNWVKDISILNVLTKLTHLDISRNVVRDINALRTLINLTSLNLSYTSIKDLNALENLVQLTNFDLSGTQVGDLSALRDLVQLTHLDLSGTQVGDLGALRDLVQLTSLDLSGTQVGDLSALRDLVQLAHLDLSRTQVGDLSALRDLVQLAYLDLSGTQVDDLSALRDLVQLTHLDLSGTQVGDLSALRDLVQLAYLDLSGTQVSDLSAVRDLVQLTHFDLNGTQVGDLSALRDLVQLTYLDLNGTQAGDLSALRDFVQLTYLNLNRTQVGDLSALRDLVQLAYLDLSGTQVSDLSELRNLVNLSELSLYSSSFLYFPLELLSLPKLEILYLQETHCRNLPPELIQESNALPALRNYYAELQKKSYTSYDAKQILIGNGRVGKTSVLKALYNLGDFNLNEDSTHGIQLFDTTLPLPEKQATANLSLWDFGGQELYHATHRIFMKTRALYLVVWDPETEAKPGEETIQLHGQDYTFRNYPLSYWLGNVRALSKDAKIILICNKCDDGKERFPPNLQELQAEYNIDSFISISARTGYGIATLRQRIQYLLNQMPEMGLQMPVSWRRVKEKLAAIRTKKPYIHIDEYHTVAATEGLSSGSMDTLLNFLHHSGFLFWNVHHLKDHPILDQKWALEAIYQLLDRNGWYPLLKGNALRRRQELAKCWKEYSKEQIDLFLHMMSSCEIALKLEDQEQENPTYLIPELLPDSPAPAVKDIWEAGTGPTYHLRFQHPFFHAALIQRFIVRTAKLAERYDLLWRTGLLFKVDATMAMVQIFPAQSRIEIQIRGKKPADLVQRIKEEIASIQRVQGEVSFQVSLSGFDNEWVALEQLTQKIKDGKSHIASITGEILELAPFLPLLSPIHLEREWDQDAPGLKELSAQVSGSQLLVPIAPSSPLEALQNQVKAHLLAANLPAAFDLLHQHIATNTSTLDNLILIHGQYQRYHEDLTLYDVLSAEERRIGYNKIQKAILELVNSLEPEDLKV